MDINVNENLVNLFNTLDTTITNKRLVDYTKDEINYMLTDRNNKLLFLNNRHIIILNRNYKKIGELSINTDEIFLKSSKCNGKQVDSLKIKFNGSLIIVSEISESIMAKIKEQKECKYYKEELESKYYNDILIYKKEIEIEYFLDKFEIENPNITSFEYFIDYENGDVYLLQTSNNNAPSMQYYKNNYKNYDYLYFSKESKEGIISSFTNCPQKEFNEFIDKYKKRVLKNR